MALTTQDVRDACDLFAPIYRSSGGVDGRVSIEVDPRLAHDTAATVAQALDLAAAVDRPNVLIKIPATTEGLPAISQVLAAGVSVNVTLIFALDRYRGVMNAFLTGLEQAREHGIDPSTIHSVASFFVSSASTPRSTPGSTRSAATRQPRCAARLPWRTHGLPTKRTKKSSRRLAGTHSRMPVGTVSDRCGPPRRQGPDVPGHAVRHRARRRGHREHDARRRCRPWPTTARSPATR